MFKLERKQLHIVKEPMTANCTTQTYRWKDYAVCSSREQLEELLDLLVQHKGEKPSNWRIEEMGCK